MKTKPNDTDRISGRTHVFRLAAAGLAVFLAALPARADGDYSDYIWLSASDSWDKRRSFDNNDAGSWKIGSLNGVVAGAPCAGNKYYAYRNLCSPRVDDIPSGVTTNFVFAGDELVMREDRQFFNCQPRSAKAVHNVTVTVPHLVMLPGSYIFVGGNSPSATAGECLVKGTDDKPSYFRSRQKDTTIRCELDFVSLSPASVFRFQCHSDEGIDVESYFRLRGDASRYEGTFLVTNTLTQVFLDTEGGYECPGGFVIGNGARMETTVGAEIGDIAVTNGSCVAVGDGCVLTVGDLSVENGSLEVAPRENAPASIVVTNAFTFSGKIRLKAVFPEPMTASLQKFPLLTLAADAEGTLSADDFEVTPVYDVADETGLSPAPEALYLRYVVETDAETGARTLYATHRRIVYLSETDNSDNPVLAGNNNSLWSDGEPVNATNDYYAIGKELAGFNTGGVYVFGGASLTIRKIKIGSKSPMTFSSCDYRLVGVNNSDDDIMNRSISCAENLVFTNCTVTVISNGYPMIMQPYGGHTITFSCELKGSGDIRAANYSDSGAPTAVYDISGLNTNFTGGVRIYRYEYKQSGPLADPTNYCITVRVRDQRNLGGTLGAFRADALSIEKLSLLDVVGSVVFDDPTRGWSVTGQGRINVADGETVTVTNKQITYSGEFMKEGGGTLALGGTARFTADQAETPLEGTNVLSVLGGSLMPADVTGCDGLAVRFAPGTGLVLDAGATGDLEKYGLYNVKCDEPLTVTDGTALPVSFRMPADFDDTRVREFGICTVNADAAASMSADGFEVSFPGTLKGGVFRRTNADETVTFACRLIKKGFVLSVR